MAQQPTRTFGPLHFEDLAPSRFEDLVRQLIYDFRTWKYIDATGALGADEGTDIRAIEVSGGVSEDDDESQEPLEEREWRLQCRRYRRFGPSQAKTAAIDLIPDRSTPPYGVLLAVPVDVSARTISAFRAEAQSRGASEIHLWGRAVIEDRLFLPQNDHLLFVYFGVSIRVRQAGRLQVVRTMIATKRKILRSLELDSVQVPEFCDQNLLVRDIEADFDVTQDREAIVEAEAPFTLCVPFCMEPLGLAVNVGEYSGMAKRDGSWDLLPSSKRIPGELAQRLDFAGEIPSATNAASPAGTTGLARGANLMSVLDVRFLPFDRILEIDPRGDSSYPCPHFFCRYEVPHGPFISEPHYYGRVIGEGEDQWLDPARRAPLYSG